MRSGIRSCFSVLLSAGLVGTLRVQWTVMVLVCFDCCPTSFSHTLRDASYRSCAYPQLTASVIGGLKRTDDVMSTIVIIPMTRGFLHGFFNPYYNFTVYSILMPTCCLVT
ncbi:hypothetical protein F5B19DRAFT_404245 [Rostrohypoxylon terebratum]|nr:hypothetical protein F5B19DRAFT_404245 [Rostrohypoxylon terebratum]